ncbi:MAG: RHS repeat-associated core domain-containing protein, partial [Clostridia bacterium]
RGYVWDVETGYYYLRSRYYDPAWGRFINADESLGKPGLLLRHNVQAYCANAPIMYSDTDGRERIYTYYYYFEGSQAPLKEQAESLMQYKDDVKMIAVGSAEQFVTEWNAMGTDAEEVYLYLHGKPGGILFNAASNDSVSYDPNDSYSLESLMPKNLKVVHMYSCYGAAETDKGSVAEYFAKITKGKVIACTVGVSYWLPFGVSYPRVNALDYLNWFHGFWKEFKFDGKTVESFITLSKVGM